ncbi:hypothetical protein [uncultured Cohaesibacter sp.]|uniref:hypothetical protein n=1 Tax=uncultured Cohaesibacter sp. TaxID=1002546 RepID=UPI0029C63F44|nr:hypothetical protein [uncultured Cohaesibacter sp.]
MAEPTTARLLITDSQKLFGALDAVIELLERLAAISPHEFGACGDAQTTPDGGHDDTIGKVMQWAV